MIDFVFETLLEQLPGRLSEFGLRESVNFGVEFGAYPPPVASDWYIAMDYAGESQTAGMQQYFIREEYSFLFGIWRRQTEVPRDRLGRMNLRTDLYRPQATTIQAMSRALIKTIHQKFWLTTEVGLKIDAHESYGNKPIAPLIYLGSGANEEYTVDSMRTGDVETFIGRRLKFRGLTRQQTVEEMG